LLGSIVGPYDIQRGKLVICDIQLKDGRKGWLAWTTDQEIVADLSALLTTGYVERLLGDGEERLEDFSRTNIGQEPILIYRKEIGYRWDRTTKPSAASNWRRE
jgi:hypothetical protein